MFRFFTSICFATAAAALALPPQPPAEFWHNRGSVTDPQVNAVNVINDGRVLTASTRPWDAQNVLTFTNRGYMLGSPGFRFEYVDPKFGFRRAANSFFNFSDILAADSGIGFTGFEDDDGTIINFVTGFFSSSLIKVHATNIVNRGLLNVGANGFIQLHGINVDLTAGRLVVGDIDDPLSGGITFGGLPNFNETNFFPSPGIFDLGWGLGSFTNARYGAVLQGVNPASVSTPTPPGQLTNGFGFGGGGSAAIQLDEAMLWAREDVIDETNEIVQIIAVQTSDPAINVLASFVDIAFDNDPLEGGYLTHAVEFQVGQTDFTTLQRVTNSLYVLDQLGSGTNRALMQNLQFGTFRPGNFVVFRDFPNLLFGEPAHTNVREDILIARQDGIPYVNTTVFTNEWAGYLATVRSIAALLPGIPGVGITNLGGQVEINAKELLLRNTRIRGEGYVSISGSNTVVSGNNNLIDAPRLSLYFGAKNGDLRVNELVPDAVERFHGDFKCHGSIFTNYYERVGYGPPEYPATEPTIVTQQVEVRFHITIIDARNLQTQEPVSVFDLHLTSTNAAGSVFFNENMIISNSVIINAREITFAEGSSLDLPAGWALSYSNLINVQVITNLGDIFLEEMALLQNGPNTPLQRFVNGGSFAALGLFIWADEFLNTNGTLISGELLEIRASDLRIDGGTFINNFFGRPDLGGDLRLIGDNIRFGDFQADVGERLVLDASQSLNDAGLYAPNLISVARGVEMIGSPSGSLLGTTIALVAPPLDFISVVWGSDDRGANVSGFDNNLALGSLVLTGGPEALYEFRPSRPGAAIYIDLLDISGGAAESLDMLTNSLILEMNVYYSDVISTNAYITAQSLDRIFGPNAPFNLIHVPGFAGAIESVAVQLGRSGPTVQMNRTLRLSTTIDSDGDGIVNALDTYPLTASAVGDNEVRLTGPSRTGNGTFSFSVGAASAETFVIEHSSNLATPDWKPVSGTLTAADLGASQTFNAAIAQGSGQGYFRVRIVK
ncbi:MAG TPA: hypothetical protein VF773_09290 [Verrucomicrobiae bacterium]